MKNNIMIMNFSGVYEIQGLKAALEKKVDSVVAENMIAKPVITQLDFQDIPGTNCYCDSLAEEEIGKRIAPFGPDSFFRFRQLPLSDKAVVGADKGTL